ncbi:hypothetical protein ACH4TV_24845 [Streptomyces sp. NPDC020898]|uniref:hypothetical protein n=1 Tax=Streptomyces sp. NPDC020898 TaxID=3365101 RepID=UPI0037BB2CF8
MEMYEMPLVAQTESPADHTTAASASGHALNTLKWALLIPVTGVAAGVLGQYSYGMWAGVVVTLAVAATAAVVAGGVWHRAGAATLASVAALALPFFAGPAFYETYIKQLGERVHAVVADTGERRGVKRSTQLAVCRVVDTTGTARDLSQQQNCYGQFEVGQEVVLFRDPQGALGPWIEARPGARTPDVLGLGITAGLFLTAGSALFYAGQRRRS